MLLKLKQKFEETNLFDINSKEFQNYLKLLENKKEHPTDSYYEGHHGFCKCISKYLKQKQDDTTENIFYLSKKEHLYAHLYIAKCCINKDLFVKLIQPLTMLKKDAINRKNINLTNTELKKIINEINNLYIKRYEIKKEKDIKFYIWINTFLEQKISFSEIERKHNVRIGTYNGRYLDICDKYGLENKCLLSPWSFEKQIAFYNDVNTYLDNGKKLTDYDRDHNTRIGHTGNMYSKIYIKYNLPNHNLYFNIEFQKTKEKEYFRTVEKMLKQKRMWEEIAKEFSLTCYSAKKKYLNICRKNKTIPIKNNEYWLKKKEKEEYNLKTYKLISNYFKVGKTALEIDKIFNWKEGKTKWYYPNLCKKLNLPNLNPKHLEAWNKQEEIEFYNFVSKKLKEGLKFCEIKKIKKCRIIGINQKYFNICKKYKLKSFARIIKGKRTKEEALLIYKKINKYFNQGLNYDRIDEIEQRTKGYTRRLYSHICEKYKLKNECPFMRGKTITKEELKKAHISYYNKIKNRIQNGEKIIDIAKELNITSKSLSRKMMLYYKKYNLEKY